MENTKNVADVLRELRESYMVDGQKASLRKLAKELGIAHAHISEIERGIRPPSQAELKKYHMFFKVSYEYLLGETDRPTSADVFPENPITESIVDSRMRLLQESDVPAEKEMLDVINFLLGEEKGLLLLYYIAQWKTKGTMKESLLEILEDIQTNKNDKYSYTELRMIYDNVKKNQ